MLSPDIIRLARLLVPDELRAPSDLAPEDWEKFARLADEQGLSGLLDEAVQNQRLALPDRAEMLIKGGAQRIASRNALLMRELEHVLRPLNRANIPVMLLKGAALQSTLYPAPSLRPMSDLDILVRACDAEAAHRTLLENSCRNGADLVREDFFPRFHYEVELWTRSPGSARVDLHARPFRPLRYARIIPDDALWHYARPINVGSAVAWVPSPERLLLHLAAHAAFHGCSRLIWVYDLVRFVRVHASTLDWDGFLERSGKWGLAAAVQAAVRRTSEIFAPFLPRNIELRLFRLPTQFLDRQVLRQAPRDAASPTRHVICTALSVPGLWFRMQYLAAVLFPGDRHLASLYAPRHRGWKFCATLLRLVRVGARILGIATRSKIPELAT